MESSDVSHLPFFIRWTGRPWTGRPWTGEHPLVFENMDIPDVPGILAESLSAAISYRAFARTRVQARWWMSQARAAGITMPLPGEIPTKMRLSRRVWSWGTRFGR